MRQINRGKTGRKRLRGNASLLAVSRKLIPIPDTGTDARQLSMLLYRCREAIAMHSRKGLAVYNLTDLQWRVLRLLSYEECLDASDLARQSYLLKESLSRIIKDLTKRELIARRVSDHDARRFLLSLTSKGRALLVEVSPALNPIFEEIEARVGLDQIKQLNTLLSGLLKELKSFE